MEELILDKVLCIIKKLNLHTEKILNKAKNELQLLSSKNADLW